MKPVYLLPLLIFAVSGCGPGVADGAYPISNGYVFYETGGNGKTIEYEERKDWTRTIVSVRVDAYILDGNKIIVARRPADTIERDGMSRWKLSSTCEYWMVDTVTHAVEQITDVTQWPSVRCDMGKTYGAEVERGK